VKIHEFRRHDIGIWIVMASLFVLYAAKIPFINNSLAFAGQKSAPLISEVMSSNNGTITDACGQYSDWTEIYNPTDQPINLAGFSLTDDPEIPSQYVFPYWVLDPGDYIIVYADDQQSTGTELHVPFKLKDKGETLILSDSEGTELQRIRFPALETNHSYAIDMNTSEWSPTERCTPGFPNTDEGYRAYKQTRKASSPVAINEVMASNTLTLRDEDGDYSDWLELYNSSAESIDLSGWGLSDSEDNPKRWEFPDTQISPSEHLIVFLSGKNRSVSKEELHTDFKLNTFKDTVLLSNRCGQIVCEVPIRDLQGDMSYAQAPDSGEWRVNAQPTPGYPNTVEGWNEFRDNLRSSTDAPIVISEIMSSNVCTLQDQYGEYPDWIELFNQSGSEVDLSGWGLTDDTCELGRWRLPSIKLSPGEYLTVYASGRDSIISKKKAHTDFSLKTEGDIVVLTAPDGAVADYCCLPCLRMGLTFSRQPDGRFVFCEQPTPGEANAGGFMRIAAEPVFSIQAGMYDGPLQVELSADTDADIYYTLDGTVPNTSSIPYIGPISIEETTAIRAVAYQNEYLLSGVACATYLIEENINIPVVSIITDPANLFDEQTGIYANGPGWTAEGAHFGANYWQDWERPAHMELLEPDGTVGISQNVGIKIFGGYSRVNGQKSFALMSRGEYGKSTFDYRVFPELPYTSYKDLVIRSAQDGYWTYIREKLQVDMVLETSDIDAQAHRQSILFINGAFWGIYDLIEKLNEHFLAQHYNVHPDNINLLEHNGEIIEGSNKDYLALIEYVDTHDLSIPENYQYISSQVDIDNFIDWCTIQIFIANNDFVHNTKFWKASGPDSKWRWILFDLDWGYRNLYQDERSIKRLDFISSFIRSDYDIDTTLLKGLLKNEDFKRKFIERNIYHYKITFSQDKVLAYIDELTAIIKPYVQRDRAKWGKGSMESWRQELQLLKDFAIDRPAINLHFMQEYFNLSDTEMEQLLQETGNE